MLQHRMALITVQCSVEQSADMVEQIVKRFEKELNKYLKRDRKLRREDGDKNRISLR